MARFVISQPDLVALVALCAFFLCCMESFVLRREEGPTRRWTALFAFFLLQGLSFLWLIAAQMTHAGWAALVAPSLGCVSFYALFPMADYRFLRRLDVTRQVLLSLAPLALCAAAGAAFGAAVAGAVAGVLICIPGTCFAVSFLLSVPEIRVPGRPWLATFAAIFALYGLLAVSFAFAPTMPDQARLVLTPLAALLSIGLALTLTVHEWRVFLRMKGRPGRPTTRNATIVAVCALPLVLAAGGLLTVTLGDTAVAGITQRTLNEADMIQGSLAANTGELDRDVLVIARAPQMADAVLGGPSVAVRAAVLDLLENFIREVPAVAFALDKNGRIVFASSRVTPTFLSGSYDGEPWFRVAVAGESGRVFRAGTGGEPPAYFTAVPIWSLERGIVGVVALERRLSTFFPQPSPGSDIFLVDENGNITWAGHQDLIGRPLWPFRDTRAAERIPVLGTRSPSGALISWKGGPAVVARSFLPVAGWSVEELASVEGAAPYRLAGILLTFAIALLLNVFAATSRIALIGEIRVERSESLYRALVEGSPNWVSMVEESGIFLFTNMQGRAALGVGDPAAKEVPIESVIGEGHVAEIAAQVRQSLASGTLSFETALPTADGGVRIWRVTLIPRQGLDSPTRTAVLIANDITDARKAEARLIRAEKLAALGGLAAGVAHQFNNLDSILLWNLQLLRDLDGLPAEAARYLDPMREALERATEITSRLLPLAASSSVGPPYPLVGQVVRAVLARMRPDLERDAVSVELDLADGEPVAFDARQLEFIVGALLGNALHAVLDRKERRIKVSTFATDGFALLRVEDTGQGIDPSKIARIFTPFFSEKGEHAERGSPLAKVRGVGLSLNVSYSVAAAAGGRMDVESPPGRGAVFSLWLPLAPREA